MFGEHGLRRGVDERRPRPRSLCCRPETAGDVGRHPAHQDHPISQGRRHGSVGNRDETRVSIRRGYVRTACARAPAGSRATRTRADSAANAAARARADAGAGAARPGAAAQARAAGSGTRRAGLRAGPTSDIAAGVPASRRGIGAARGGEQDDSRPHERLCRPGRGSGPPWRSIALPACGPYCR